MQGTLLSNTGTRDKPFLALQCVARTSGLRLMYPQVNALYPGFLLLEEISP